MECVLVGLPSIPSVTQPQLCATAVPLNCSPFMITGEVAQDLLDSDTPANSSSTSISNSTTGKAPAHAAGGAASGAAASTAAVDPATAGAQGQGQGVLGLTAAAVSAAGRKLSKVSGVASDAVGWQLHKWPTEASEMPCLMSHDVKAVTAYAWHA
jgi:hypothetical protein